MNTRKLLVSLFASLWLSAGIALAQDTLSNQATIVGVGGSATVTLPDGTTSPAVNGAKLPAGATIKTGADGKVMLQAFTGTIATIDNNTEVSLAELSTTSANGKVTQETTTIDLKNGNLVSALDPKKKSVNNYKVRTPKGVAAARGTSFQVRIKIQTTDSTGAITYAEYNVIATSGNVVITPVGGGAPISIVGGQASMSNVGDGSATNLADLPTEAKATAVAAMGNVLAALAVAADNGLISRTEFTAVTQNVMNAVGNDAAAAQTIAQTVAQNTYNAESRNAVTNAASDSVKQSVQQTIDATQTSPGLTNHRGNSVDQRMYSQNTTTEGTTIQRIDVSVISKSN